MRLSYLNPEGGLVVSGFPPQSELANTFQQVADMDSDQFQSWAISQVDPDGVLNITVLSDDDPLPLTPEEAFQALVKQFDAAVEAHLHTEATSKGYTNIERACMYAAYPNPFQSESQSFVKWVGDVWAYCYTQLQNVEVGLRPIPTVEQIVSELPVRVVP